MKDHEHIIFTCCNLFLASTATDSLWVREPGREDVEESRERDETDERVVDGHVLQFCHGNDTVGVKAPVGQQNNTVAEI